MNSNVIIFIGACGATCIAAAVFYLYQLQKKLNLVNQELKKTKTDLAGFAHDISNPLAVISARAQILQSQFELDKFDTAQITKSIDTIASMAERIVKILKSIRLFAKDPQSDKLELVSLNDLIDETITLLEMRSTKFSVQIQKIGFESDVIIECSPAQTFQILWKAMNSCIDAVSSNPEKWIKLVLLEDRANIRLEISDSSLKIAQVLTLPKKISN